MSKVWPDVCMADVLQWTRLFVKEDPSSHVCWRYHIAHDAATWAIAKPLTRDPPVRPPRAKGFMWYCREVSSSLEL